MQVLWWRRYAWGAPGAFGPVIMPLDQALDFIVTEGFFWINADPQRVTKRAKSSSECANYVRHAGYESS